MPHQLHSSLCLFFSNWLIKKLDALRGPCLLLGKNKAIVNITLFHWLFFWQKSKKIDRGPKCREIQLFQDDYPSELMGKRKNFNLFHSVSWWWVLVLLYLGSFGIWKLVLAFMFSKIHSSNNIIFLLLQSYPPIQNMLQAPTLSFLLYHFITPTLEFSVVSFYHFSNSQCPLWVSGKWISSQFVFWKQKFLCGLP